jgi:TonB family protein
METQAISAPVDRLTREAPKRQVGYGLPCAKCHKYFPADLEVCPICKGRERASPIVAPRIPKPVQSETSVALSSSNIAVKLEGKESPKSESPALAPPIEIKVKEQPLDRKESITTPVMAEVQVVVETAPVIVAPVETQWLIEDEPVTIPATANVQAAIELVSEIPVTATVTESAEEMESPMSAGPVEDPVKDLSFDQLQELIAIPTLAEVQSSAAPVTEKIALVQVEYLPKELELPESAVCILGAVQDEYLDGQLNQEEAIAIVAVKPSTAPVAENSAPVLEEQPVPTAAAPVLEEEELTSQMESPASAVSAHIAVEDQHMDDINQVGPIVIPAPVEAQAYDPVPAAVIPMREEEEFPQESESAFALPIQKIDEDHCLDLLYPAEPIVIPALADAQAYEPAPVAAEQKEPKQEKKEEVPVVLATPTAPVEVKIVESSVAYKETDTPPTKPAGVTAPVVVHLNLGELRAPKGTPERAPALMQFKKVEPTEPETSRVDISSDAYASEPPVTASSRRFDIVTFALGVVVLACAVLLITLVSLRLMPHHVSAEPVRRAKPAYNVAPTADHNTNSPLPAVPPPSAAASGVSASSNSSVVIPPVAQSPAPTPSANEISSSAQPGRPLTLTPGLAEGNLLYRVEPDYPEEARRQGIQGPVVLDLHIAKDGTVQGADLVSGQPLLAQAATAAVKQWRFRTRYVNGNEVEMQARITLHFALPTP